MPSLLDLLLWAPAPNFAHTLHACIMVCLFTATWKQKSSHSTNIDCFGFNILNFAQAIFFNIHHFPSSMRTSWNVEPVTTLEIMNWTAILLTHLKFLPSNKVQIALHASVPVLEFEE